MIVNRVYLSVSSWLHALQHTLPCACFALTPDLFARRISYAAQYLVSSPRHGCGQDMEDA
jgi:hypothetical protein